MPPPYTCYIGWLIFQPTQGAYSRTSYAIRLVEIAISTNPIYRNLYENTGPGCAQLGPYSRTSYDKS